MVCPPCLIDYQDLCRTRIRERNEGEKITTGYPRDEYRGHVVLPPYFDQRPSTPQSLGYASNTSQPTTFGPFTTYGRVIADTKNSPTKIFSSILSSHSEVVLEEVSSSQKKLPQPATRPAKENRSVIYNKPDPRHRPPQPEPQNKGFERVGHELTPNLYAKRFKADNPHHQERSDGWEGTGEKERSGYQPDYRPDRQTGHRPSNYPDYRAKNKGRFEYNKDR